MFAFFGGSGSTGMSNPMSRANSLIVSGPLGVPQELQSAAGQLLITDPITGAASFASGGRKRFFKTVLANSAGLITIPNIPSGWSRLIIELVGRSDANAAQVIQMQFNGDTSTHYNSTYVENATVLSLNNAAYMKTGTFPFPTGLAGVAAPLEILIPLYSGTTFQKTVLFWYGRYESATNYVVGSGTGYWTSTAAISSVVLSASPNNLIAGTVCNAYVEM